MSGGTTVKGGRILVVDDEPMLRDTLAQVLTEEGYVVDSATDGVEALDRVRAARPDAILLDLMMPGMNGRQFLQALRDDPEYHAIPVLIMTAVHGLEVNLDGSEVVEKPFQVEDLLNKVALAVYRSRDADRIVALPPGPSEPARQEPADRGVVLIVEHDRHRLQQLDVVLSGRGYTVVSMTRALAQLSRLARALRPRAILLEMTSEGVVDVLRDLRIDSDITILVYTRGTSPERGHTMEILEHASDADLVSFVDRQSKLLM
jgi:DNA-binding response OmpR family regulator